MQQVIADMLAEAALSHHADEDSSQQHLRDCGGTAGNLLLIVDNDMMDHASLNHPSAGSSEILSASSSPAPSAGCRGLVSIATSPSDGSGATDPDAAGAMLAAGVSAGADSILLASSQTLACVTLHQTGSCLKQQDASVEGHKSSACSLLMTVPILMQQHTAGWVCSI